MNEEPKKTALSDEVERKETRMLRARRTPKRSALEGLGIFGLIGWSIVVPTLVGAAVGGWLVGHYPGGRNWTLVLLVAGLSLGCLNAWHWVAKEHRAINEDAEHDD